MSSQRRGIAHTLPELHIMAPQATFRGLPFQPQRHKAAETTLQAKFQGPMTYRGVVYQSSPSKTVQAEQRVAFQCPMTYRGVAYQGSLSKTI